MTCSCCFSLGGILDFKDFLQKKFYNIDYRPESISVNLTCNVVAKYSWRDDCSTRREEPLQVRLGQVLGQSGHVQIGTLYCFAAWTRVGNLKVSHGWSVGILFSKWANPGLFYCLFSVFSSKHHYNFYSKYMWKMLSSIQCRDSNPRPSEHGSPPTTTRLVLLPPLQKLIIKNLLFFALKSLRALAIYSV